MDLGLAIDEVEDLLTEHFRMTADEARDTIQETQQKVSAGLRSLGEQLRAEALGDAAGMIRLVRLPLELVGQGAVQRGAQVLDDDGRLKIAAMIQELADG